MAEDISGIARELADVMAEVQRDMARYGRVTAETADRLVDAQMKAKFGIENFTKGMGKATDAVGSLAAAGMEAGKAMYEGKKGAAAFNSSLDQLSAAATAAGTALALLIPGGFIVKGLVAGLTMATTAAIAYTKAANEMADKLYTGYSKLQESGAAAADGMTGVFNDAKKLGLSMNQLDSMIGLVANNSQELALLSGSVAKGRQRFAEVGEALESSRAGFFKMGISQEAQNEGLMRYTRNMTLAGRAQNMTTKELEAGAKAYIYEQDKLTKLTGMSAQKQQALLDRARENEQFNAKLRMLELKGDAESLAAAERLKQGLQVAAMAGDESAEAFMASVNGNLRNQAAQKANLSTFGEMGRYARDLEAGTTTATKGFEKVASAGADYEKTIGVQRSALDAGTESQFKTSTMQKLALINQIGIDEARKKIEADQLRQQEGKGDAITDQYGNMIKKQQDINKKLETDVFKGIPNALANMDRLANVTDKLADAFSALTTGLNKLLNLVGLGVPEPKKPREMTKAEATAAKATDAERTNAKPLQDRVENLSKQLDADEKALKDAKRAGKFGDDLKPIEERILKNKEEYEKASKELLDAEKKIRESAMKEADVRRKQKRDRAELGRLESMNLHAAEQVARLNEKKANLVKEGKSTAEVDTQIQEKQKAMTERGATISTLKAGLETEAPKSAAGSAKPEEVIQFTGASGQRENFENLSEGMKTSLLAAGQQYFEQTGKKLQMNSGARSPEDQKRLYEETVQAGRPGIGPNGMPVAPPGRSSHESGMAVDIQNYTDPKAMAALNANSLRQTVPNDPVHFQLQAADGGVFSGPDEGYPIIAHGDEAVVPLNNGSGNFVKVFEDMAMMMGKQVGAIDELIRVAKNGNDIQTKILRIQS